jgi:hypothetical protein
MAYIYIITSAAASPFAVFQRQSPFHFTLVLLLFSGFLFAQGPLLDSDFPNINKTYVNSIRSIKVYQSDSVLNPAVISLNTNERLNIAFDDLSPDLRRIQYTVRHCSFDWNTSTDLVVSDYIDGFKEQNIDQYLYSYNTTIPYIHYSATLPSDNLRLKISGNYLLIVYEEDTRQVLFTQRFMVYESSPLTLDVRVGRGMKMEEKETHQQVDVLVKLNGFSIMDVTREIRLGIRQNGRWDNFLYVAKPRITRPGELDYRYDEAIAFPGWNQYRYFDTKSLLYQSERIRKITYDTAYHVYLLDDLPRTYKNYVQSDDLNGRYYIKNEEHAQNNETEADYAYVNFFLPYPVEITSGTFQIIGDLTAWQSDDYSRMLYNRARRGYEMTFLLKQGYYNYLYVYRSKDGSTLDEIMVEGSHWETENDYEVMVYYRPTGGSYDRLVGYSRIPFIAHR